MKKKRNCIKSTCTCLIYFTNEKESKKPIQKDRLFCQESWLEGNKMLGRIIGIICLDGVKKALKMLNDYWYNLNNTFSCFLGYTDYH